MSAAKKWDLTPEARERRRSDADELSQHNSKDRDRLRHAQARLAEVKELIRGTDLGQELKELKDEVKFLESGIDSRSERIEKLLQEAAAGQTSEPQDALPGVDTSKPPKAPKAPKPSAAARTLQLPEHAGPGLTDEAELHEGGPLAPEAPTVHLALPAARHADAIEAEVIEEESGLSKALRETVLDVLKDDPRLWSQLMEWVDRACWANSLSSPSEPQLKTLVASMVKSGAVVYVDDRGLYQLPEAGAVEEPSEANVQRALLQALPRDGSWMPGEALVALLQGDMPGLTLASIGRCLVDLKASGKIGRKISGQNVLWCLLPEAPKAKPSKGKATKASKPAPKKAPAKKAGGGKASTQPSPHRAEVVRALENATKRRSVRALVTTTGLGEYAVEYAIEELLRDGIVVRARRGGYQLASKAESRPSKPAKKAPPAPPPCPPPPAQGHPQRVLRGWVYDRVAHTGQLPLETLQKESPGYHQEYIEGVVDLLLACDCLHLTAGLLRALEAPAPAPETTIFDAMAGVLRDAPLTSAQIAKAFEVHHVIIFDVLQELRDAGRVALRGDAWHLTHGAQEEAA